MPDALYTDSRVQTTFPDEYMRLLNPVCGGHALWSPRRSSSGGGALGDVGTIVNGAFYKEFNLFDGPMSHHAEDVSRGEPYSKSFMSSSRDSRIEFHIMGTTNIAPLPLETLAVRPQITLHEGKDGLAFLAPPMPTHWDTIHPTARTTVANWLAQQVQSDPVGFENRVVVTEVIRSSGYIGGLMLSQRREMSSSLTLDGPISASVGGSAGQHRSLNAELRGPHDWTPESPAEYPLILMYSVATTRRSWLARAKAKIGLAGSRTTQAGFAPDQSGSPNSASTSSSTPTLPQPSTMGASQLAMDAESASIFDTVTCSDSNPMTMFLDNVFLLHPDVDVVTGDLSVMRDLFQNISVSVAASAHLEWSRVQPVIEKQVVHTTDGKTHGLVAFLTALTLDDEPLNLRPLAGPLIGRSTAQSPAEPQNHASDFQQAGQDPDSDSALYLHKWLQWRGMHNSLQWTEVSVTRRGGTQGSWTVCAYIDNVEYGKATAESKTEARRIAALMALSQLGVRV